MIQSTWTDQDERCEPVDEYEAIEILRIARRNGWTDRAGRWVSITDPPVHKTRVWLDDVRRPADWDYQNDADRSSGPWVWVQTYDETVEALASGRYDTVSLDYCLEATDPRHNGLDVAKWIARAAEAGELKRLDMRVHSFNSDAAREMRPYFQAADLSWKAKERSVNDAVQVQSDPAT